MQSAPLPWILFQRFRDWGSGKYTDKQSPVITYSTLCRSKREGERERRRQRQRQRQRENIAIPLWIGTHKPYKYWNGWRVQNTCWDYGENSLQWILKVDDKQKWHLIAPKANDLFWRKLTGTWRVVLIVIEHDNNAIQCTKRLQTFVIMQLHSSRGCSQNVDPCCQVPSGNYPGNGEMIPFSVPGHGLSNYGVVGASASDHCRSLGLGSFSPNWKRLIFYACFMPQPFPLNVKQNFSCVADRASKIRVSERLNLLQSYLFTYNIYRFVCLLKAVSQERVYWTTSILIIAENSLQRQ